MINLGRGWPDPDLLPALKDLLQDSVDENQNVAALQYGEDQGNHSFRQAISTHLRRGAVNPENILITNGSSQGLDLVCSRFCKSGDHILVENLSYFYVRGVFDQHQLVAWQVPHCNIITNDPSKTGGTLMDLDALETKLIDIQTNGKRPVPKLLYTIPVCHNPTGATMNEDKARRLIKIAKRFDIKIVADEVYLFLAFNYKPLPRSLLEYDDGEGETVIALNSFSKILGPGLRLGWIEAHTKHIKVLEQTGFIQSGGGLNPFASIIVESFIRNGKQEKYIKHLCTIYQQRCKVMTDSLQQDLGAVEVTIEHIMLPDLEKPCYVSVTGGFFLWLRLPTSWHIDVESFLEYCKNMEHPLSFFAGHKFLIGESIDPEIDTNNGWWKNSIRLCFAYLDEDDIRLGISRLANALFQVTEPSDCTNYGERAVKT